MKNDHPSQEVWMEYLYDEASPDQRRTLDAHLATCETCRHSLSAWQRTTDQLDAWKLTPHVPARRHWSQLWLRAAAAILLLATGVVAGHWTSHIVGPPAGPSERWQSDFNNVRAQLLAELKKQQATEIRSLMAALQRVDQRRAEDYASLRKALETVAVLTEAGLEQTQEQLVRLATYTQPTATE